MHVFNFFLMIKTKPLDKMKQSTNLRVILYVKHKKLPILQKNKINKLPQSVQDKRGPFITN